MPPTVIEPVFSVGSVRLEVLVGTKKGNYLAGGESVDRPTGERCDREYAVFFVNMIDVAGGSTLFIVAVLAFARV